MSRTLALGGAGNCPSTNAQIEIIALDERGDRNA